MVHIGDIATCGHYVFEVADIKDGLYALPVMGSVCMYRKSGGMSPATEDFYAGFIGYFSRRLTRPASTYELIEYNKLPTV